MNNGVVTELDGGGLLDDDMTWHDMTWHGNDGG